MYWDDLNSKLKKLIGGRIIEASWNEILIEKDGNIYRVYPQCHASSCWDENYEEITVECSYDEWLEMEEVKTRRETIFVTPAPPPS